MKTARFRACHDGFRRGCCAALLQHSLALVLGLARADQSDSSATRYFRGDAARELAAAFACLKAHAVLHQGRCCS